MTYHLVNSRLKSASVHLYVEMVKKRFVQKVIKMFG